MSSVNRRDFVKASAGAAAAGTVALGNSAFSGAPSDRVRVAVVGLRGQGGSHTSNYLKMPNVEIVALCDIDDAQFDKHLRPIAAGR